MDLKKYRQYLPPNHLRHWLMLVALVLSLMAFEEVADDVFNDPREGDYEAQTFDKSISTWVKGYRTVSLNQIMTDITALGSISVIVTFFVLFVSILASFRDFKGVAFVSLVLCGAGLWPYLLKMYFARGRPEQVEWLTQVASSSFPSGHSFGAAAAYLGFAFYATQYARSWSHEVFFLVLGATLAALVGISRIYLGVHYPTDVLAGLSGGVAWAVIASAGYLLLTKKHERPQP